MARGINKAIILGNVGRDPDVKTLDFGKLANMSVATSESWRNRQTGEWEERTEWHRVTVMDEKLVDVVADKVKKGSMVYLEGEIKTRKWTDQSGNDRYSTEIILNKFRGVLQVLPSAERPVSNRLGGGRRDHEEEIPF